MNPDIKVVPAVLAIIQYFSAFFSKKRRIICCNEKWKKAKIEADELTMDGSQPEQPVGSYRYHIPTPSRSLRFESISLTVGINFK